MATPQDRLAGLEERIKSRRDRNVRLASRVQKRTQDRALEAAGVPSQRLEADPETGGIRIASSAADGIVRRERARRNIAAGHVSPLASLDTEEERARAVQTLTPKTGSRTQNVSEADLLLADARPIERFIARQQAFTPLGGLSKAIENTGAAASFVLDPGGIFGTGERVREGVRRRRALEAATEEQDQFQDVGSKLASVGTDFFQVAGELVALRRVPGVGRALAGEVTGAGSTALRRVANRAAIEAAAGGAVESGVGFIETGDIDEAARRGRFGMIVGAGIGGALGGVAERIATRRAARAAAAETEAAAERAAAVVADKTARRGDVIRRRVERLQRESVASVGDPARALPPGRPDTPEGVFALGGRSREAQQASLAEGERLVREGFEQAGALGPERQLPPGGPDVPGGAIPRRGQTASAREQLRVEFQRARAEGQRVEGVTRAAREAIEGRAPMPEVRTSRVTEPGPPDEVAGIVQALKRRIDDGQRQLEEAFTDPLTGLRNQGAWRRAAHRFEGNPGVEIVSFDMGNLKAANDLVDPQFGDSRLKAAGQAILQAADEAGIPARDVFRAGGDEFMVAVPRGQGDAVGRAAADAFGSPAIKDTGFENSLRFGVGPDRATADAAMNAAKVAETGRKFRDLQADFADPLPTVAQPRSIEANMGRRSVIRRFMDAARNRAPAVTGRPAMTPPTNGKAGADGPLDFDIDPKSGRQVPNQRTNGVRRKSTFTDRSDAGFVVDPSPDPLEIKTGTSNLAPHDARVQAQISVGEGKGFRLPSLLDLYTSLVRRTAGIEKAGELLGPGREGIDGIGQAAHLASGSERRAEGFLEYGPFRWLGNGDIEQTGTPGFTEILAPFKGRLNELRRYLLAARTLEVGQAGRDIKTGVDLADAQRVVGEASADVKQAQRQIVNYLRDVARYYGEAADLPEEQLRQMFALGEDYIPLTRVFEGADEVAQTGGGTVGRAGQVFRRLTGSKRPIQDPLESVVDYTKRMIRAADTNRISRNLVNAAEATPEASVGLIARVENPPKGILTQAAERLQKSAAARGQTLTDDQAIALAEALGADQLNITDDVIRVWKDGQLQAYRVAPSIAKGIRALQPRDMDMFLKLAGFIPKTLKAGVTLNPGFQAFNIIRDSFDAAIQSEHGFKLGVDSFRGFYQSAKANWLGAPSERYKEFVQAGGGFSSLRGSGRRSTQAQLRRVLPVIQSRTGRVIDIATLPIRQPVQLLKDFAAPFEEAARVAEYMRARSQDASAVDAVLASKKVTVDFQQIGANMQGLSYATAFLNAGLQSLDTAFRVGVRPVTRARAADGAPEAAGVFLREAAQVYGTAIGAVSLPSMYFWAASKDDAEIQDLRKTPAGLIFWFMRTPENDIIRIPKPFMWGQIFGTGMESALDQFVDQDPDAAERFAQGLRDQAGINMFPNAVQIPVEQFANRSIAFGTPIVPQELERLEPRAQSTERTTRLATKIGELTNASPARIDKVMRDIGGTLPADILRFVDQSIDRFEGDAITEPAPIKADRLFIGRFFQRSPSLSTESVQTFWENALAAEEAMATFKHLEERGDPNALQALYDRRFEDFAVAATYEGSRRALSEIRNSIQAVQTMPDAAFQDQENVGQQKRDLIDEYLRQYLQVARLTNEAAAAALSRVEENGGQPPLQPEEPR